MQKLFIKQASDTLQNGGTFKPWLYRGQKPGLIAKFLNRMMANSATKEAMDNGLVALEVIGQSCAGYRKKLSTERGPHSNAICC